MQCIEHGIIGTPVWNPYEDETEEVYLHGSLECGATASFNSSDWELDFSTTSQLNILGIVYEWDQFCINQIFPVEEIVASGAQGKQDRKGFLSQRHL